MTIINESNGPIYLWAESSAGGLVITDGTIYHTGMEYVSDQTGTTFRQDAAGWDEWAYDEQDRMTEDPSCIEPRQGTIMLKDTWDEHIQAEGWAMVATYADGVVTITPDVFIGTYAQEYLGEDAPLIAK